MEIKSDKKHFYHLPKNNQIKKKYRAIEVSFSHIPQNEHSSIEVGFMNDTEIQYENSKRFRLDVVWELDTAFVPFGSKFTFYKFVHLLGWKNEEDSSKNAQEGN